MEHSSVVGNSLHVGRPAAEWNGAVINGNDFRRIDRQLEKRLFKENRSFSDARDAHWLWVGLLRQGLFLIRCGYTLISIIETSANMFYSVMALLGNAARFGMTAGLKLSVSDNSVSPPVTDTSRLSWATSIFYFGQLAGPIQ